MPESEPQADTYAIPPNEPVGRFSLVRDAYMLVERGAVEVQIELDQPAQGPLAELSDEDFAQVLFDIADYFPDDLRRWSLSRLVTVPDRHALPVASNRFPTKTYRVTLSRTGFPGRCRRVASRIDLVNHDQGHASPVE